MSNIWNRDIGIRTTRTYDECKVIASYFSSLGEWQQNDSASYLYAWKRHWQEKIAKELKWKVLRKTKKSVKRLQKIAEIIDEIDDEEFNILLKKLKKKPTYS
jgi:hypothetical protein